MIDPDKRKAVYVLHREGMSAREIARRLMIGRNTVKAIIRQEGVTPEVRRDKQRIDADLLARLHRECDGYARRVHEKLTEEEGVEVTYSTLTRMLRESGIGTPKQVRCDRVPDEPGAEMQHDTTSYAMKIAGCTSRLTASLMYLRYSKRRYLRFYRVFTRFNMKCFFHEALMHWGHAASQCIIDNTNLARLRGTGKHAVIVPEMEAFAKQYAFRFVCHEKGHANRKAGEERSFWTVETNFLPGRTFASLEDLNAQALEWATVRLENRPQSKAGLIPAVAFEHERAYLAELPSHLPAPYRVHERGTDQYGYVAFAGNYYWVPGSRRDDMKVLEYAERIKLYKAGDCLADYPLPADGVKNARFSPEGQPRPRHQPKSRKRPTDQEEKRLLAMGEAVRAYLDFLLPPSGVRRHGLIRKLFALSRRVTPEVFVQSIERAHRYGITDPAAVERIVQLNITQGPRTLPCPEIDETFRQRDAYREGRLTDLPDLSDYKPPPEPEEDDHE